MNILEDMKACFGCGACSSICSFGAISMCENDEGFIEPVVDQALCTGCTACKDVCPVLHPRYDNFKNPRVIAFTASDDLRYDSSSGGAFSIIAEDVLADGGFVAGAAFQQDLSVEHVVIDSLDDLDKLRRSKYVQSNPGTCFQDVFQHLQEGHKVLYSGCPCQVAGLKSFLGKEYDNLVTVDLLCHGVPPQRHFFDYLDEMFGIENVKQVEMRKRAGWGTCFRARLNNGNTYMRASKKDTFLRAFLEDINLRPSCYGCIFARIPRQGDITLGDLWTIKQLKLGDTITGKSSLVLLNSEKGKSFWVNAIDKSTREMKYVDVTKRASFNKLNKNVSQPTVDDKTGRDAFMKLYPELGFEKATLKSLFSCNVGLVLYMSDNYGSVATNYALYKAIENCGHHPMIFDNLTAPEGISKTFINEYLNHIGNRLDRDDFHSANVMCDSFVVGSDQSWRWDFRLTIKNLEYFLMAFAASNKRKIAYAASFGKKRYSLDEVTQRFYAHMLSRFDAISVREDYAVGMCKNLFGVDAVQMADPVFLIPRKDYIELAKKSKLVFKEPFLLAYIRFPSPEKRRLIRESARQFGVKAIVVCDANGYEKLRSSFNMEEVIDKPDFVDWLSYYVHADYVITDSFHGTCFSLILQKRFLAIKAGTRERFDSLAAMIDGGIQGANSGFYANAADLLGRNDNFRDRDFKAIDQHLSRVREIGISWLRNALEAEKQASSEGRCSEKWYVDHARLLKRSIQDVSSSRTKRIPAGKTCLQAQRAAMGAKALPVDSCTRITKVDEYFASLKSRNCTFLLSAKDDCSRYWSKFIKDSKLPLSITPAFHESYLAIVYNGKKVFEKASFDVLRKHHRVLPVTSPIHKVIATLRGRGRSINVFMHSKGYNPDVHDEKSIIMVNNIDYSLDKRGINIVVVDNVKKEIIDSFNIDLYSDDQLVMVRR